MTEPILALTRSELFTRACELNALRKAAQLPLRDIRSLIGAAEDALAWKAYTAVVGQYQPVYQQLRRDVRQECIDAGKGDIAMSAGGRWLLNFKAMKLFQEFLELKGHFRPRLRGIPYGSGS